jgi:ActR/RegA family two-component response regulator
MTEQNNAKQMWDELRRLAAQDTNLPAYATPEELDRMASMAVATTFEPEPMNIFWLTRLQLETMLSSAYRMGMNVGEANARIEFWRRNLRRRLRWLSFALIVFCIAIVWLLVR